MTNTDQDAAQRQTHPIEETRGNVVAVVGFDGSPSSRAALVAAKNVVSGRPGHVEIVYVAHIAAVAGMSASSINGIRSGFGVIADDLRAQAGEALDQQEPRWSFQRRDGAVAEELSDVATSLRSRYGIDTTVVLVVGTSAHALHHVAGSVAVALTRDGHFPVLVVPDATDTNTSPAVKSRPADRSKDSVTKSVMSPRTPDRQHREQHKAAGGENDTGFPDAVTDELRLLNLAPSVAKDGARVLREAASGATAETMLTASEILEGQSLRPELENLQDASARRVQHHKDPA